MSIASKTLLKRRALVYLVASLAFASVGVYFSYPFPCDKLGPGALIGGIVYGVFSLIAFLKWARFQNSPMLWVSSAIVLSLVASLFAFIAALLLRDPSLVCSGA